MTKKSTKRGLLVSALAILVCFVMLLGTTYAWFTDSVTSTGNIIKTGTLDVTLEYKKVGDAADAWKDASTGAIFEYQNWEPGYTEVRYVKIENEGTLDLKFQLNIVPAQAAVAGEVNLADVIDVYMFADEQTVTRDAIAAATPVGTLASLIADADGAAYGVLADGEFEVYTIVLKMQESAGNEYQDLTVGGSFVVQLLATQLASESDDLGNDYDAEATYPEMEIGSASKVENSAAQVAADTVAVDVPAGAPAGNYTVEVTEKKVETDAATGKTTASMDINLKKDGVKVNADGSTVYTVSVEIGAGLELDEVTHNGTAITNYSYDIVTGVITFETDSFSPFTFTYTEFEGVVVSTMSELKAAVEAGEKLIDANGANLGDFYYDFVFTDGVVLRNAKFTYFYGGGVNGTVTFENCEFVSDHSYSANFDNGNGNVVFNNCLFDGWSSFGTAITNVEFNGCTFQKSYNYGVLRFYQNAQLNNCVIDASFEGIDNGEIAGTTITLTGCSGVEGMIYNNTVNGTVMVSTWIVDGVTLTDVPAW